MKATTLALFTSTAITLATTGCTSTQVRWGADNLREQVMVYYNDQIMDNLIRAKTHVPFVHVDIQTLTSTGGTQISGTIGNGETRTNATTSTGGVIGAITRTLTRPFSYSITPNRSEVLSLTASPALGNQALASPSAPSEPASSSLEISKQTEIRGPDGQLEKSTTEKTPKPVSASKNITIYKLYEDFADKYLLQSNYPLQPKPGAYVRGTLKRRATSYYYIDVADQKAYYNFCKTLFTKGQSTSLEKQLELIRGEVETQKSLLSIPVPPQ
jgi:hypothetical protein